MKLLLTSAGVKNPSIHDALIDLHPWSTDAIQSALQQALVEDLELKPRVAFGPVRVAGMHGRPRIFHQPLQPPGIRGLPVSGPRGANTFFRRCVRPMRLALTAPRPCGKAPADPGGCPFGGAPLIYSETEFFTHGEA